MCSLIKSQGEHPSNHTQAKKQIIASPPAVSLLCLADHETWPFAHVEPQAWLLPGSVTEMYSFVVGFFWTKLIVSFVSAVREAVCFLSDPMLLYGSIRNSLIDSSVCGHLLPVWEYCQGGHHEYASCRLVRSFLLGTLLGMELRD